MPNDPTTLIGLGIAAVVVLWLVFSVMKKVIGLVILAAVFLAGFVVWTNPTLVQQLASLLPG